MAAGWAAAFALAGAALAVSCAAPPAPEDFRGTALTANAAAADFRLTDQFGEAASLADFAGRVALVTFLYTDCPDVCPIVANHLRAAADALDADGADAAIIVISVDPQGDDVAAAREYSERWGMAQRWRYLVGDEDELRPIWASYYIDPYLHGPARDEPPDDQDKGVVGASGVAPNPSPDAAATPRRLTDGGGASALAAQTGRIIHSAPVYLIDGAGVMRVVFTLPFDPEDLAHDARLLGS